MMNTSASVRKVNVRKMTIIGVLSAISIMLSMTPLGFIPVGPTKATIMHIPVIIGAIMEGPIVGGAIGFIFGISSLLNAIINPTVTSFVFINPLVSILPRVMIGVLAYYVYQLVIKSTNKVYVSGLITGAIGSLLNTAGVLGMIYVLYADKYLHAMGQSGSAGKAIMALAAANGVPEAIVGALVVAAVATVLKKSKK
ncbi:MULTISPECIES: ECF transporter S component [unclassified Clostridioides]|uniref:ECF transporter S component n=1 Tax=unclassified Clostridioides TaxID=2635829 RepID=UPI001D10E531|nr:ECF transporter S component [Clostridioides sp. ES-S-0171-01]MCC0689429.1 ECF transporter S component [Clostridioides sp. ES-S-0056-01]MCC0716645.1 ECF transporter S component [Clostridioides sp. ES-S-0077-01]UDN54594.1 ECF transporter S component [Clostridioides sp. ES-S-0054-01]